MQQCSEATQRLIDTEERWNRELELMRNGYDTQLGNLQRRLTEAERARDEHLSTLNGQLKGQSTILAALVYHRLFDCCPRLKDNHCRYCCRTYLVAKGDDDVGGGFGAEIDKIRAGGEN